MSTGSDVAFSRSLMFYNDSKNSSRSWLSDSLKTKHGVTSAEVEEEEDIEIEADEERGLGYAEPKGVTLQDRQSLSANDKLRQQLLGHRTNSSRTNARTMNRCSGGLSASKPKPPSQRVKSAASDDEGEGRTSKAAKITRRPPKTDGPITITNPARSQGDGVPGGLASKKRPVSYLDEVLAQRQGKKKKKANSTHSNMTKNENN